jgi:flagellar biogenesis protein FliO
MSSGHQPPDFKRDRPETAAEFQRRMTVNLLGLIVALLLLIAGFWLAYKLGETKRAQDCLSAGHRNCAASQRQ